MSGSPLLAGVVGWPVGHSLSPLIHTIWADRAGFDGYYIPLAIEPDYDSFARAMDALDAVGFAGVNVTIPHKEHALRYAAVASDAARKAGAANMLTFAEDGPYADNSDIAGFAAAVREACDEQSLKSALILGAGGAARGVALALKELGVAALVVANRTRSKADDLAAAFGLTAIDWDDRNSTAGMADIIVNTTSLGMTGQPPLDFNLSAANKTALIADIVYSPLETPLLIAASARDHLTVDGLSMLMHQAAPGFRAWFGAQCRVDGALRAELVAELKRRGGP